jgi:hypothetical protein
MLPRKATMRATLNRDDVTSTSILRPIADRQHAFADPGSDLKRLRTIYHGSEEWLGTVAEEGQAGKEVYWVISHILFETALPSTTASE